MKQIELSQGFITMVDDEDFDYLNNYKWCVLRRSHTNYAVRSAKKSDQMQGRPLIRMHKAIVGDVNGKVVDHIDGNGLNNCKKNLRHVTIRQNQQNRHDEQSSKYPGVSWVNSKARYVVKIWIKDKRKYIGEFTTELDAFYAYVNALHEIGEQLINPMEDYFI